MSNTSNGIVAVYADGAAALREPSSFSVKVGLAQMLRGEVIMNVVVAEQARLAEEAGSCAVMTVEPGGGVARMPDPTLLKDIKRAVTVTVPVMAKVRIGHFVEAQILEAVGVDCVDESEVLAPADHQHHINKHNFRVPFVCGAKVERFASRKFVISPAVAVAVWNLFPSIHKVGFGLGTPV